MLKKSDFNAVHGANDISGEKTTSDVSVPDGHVGVDLCDAGSGETSDSRVPKEFSSGAGQEKADKNDTDSGVGISAVTAAKESAENPGKIPEDAENAGKNDSKTDGEKTADVSLLEEEFDRLIKGRYRQIWQKRTEAIVRKRLKSVKIKPEVSESFTGVDNNQSIKSDPNADKLLSSSGKLPENGMIKESGEVLNSENITEAELSVNKEIRSRLSADAEITQVNLSENNTNRTKIAENKTDDSKTDESRDCLDAEYQKAKERNRKRPVENGCAGSCGMVTKINVSALTGNDILSILRRVGTGEKITFR